MPAGSKLQKMRGLRAVTLLDVLAEKITRIHLMGRGEVVGLGCGFVLSVLLIFVINKHSSGWR